MLDALADGAVHGKIVLYDVRSGYGETVRYRGSGASRRRPRAVAV
jgi:hypothetical protein